MKTWQPWFGLLAASGLVVMLLGEGWLDALGFVISAAPLAYGFAAWWGRRVRVAENRTSNESWRK